MYVCRAYFALLLFAVTFVYNVHCYYAVLTHNGPIVLGATISFRAELFDERGEIPSGRFRFRWTDNAIPQHVSGDDQFEGHDTVSVWNVTYPADKYGPGMYEVQVVIDKWSIFYWEITSQRAFFNVTATLNGGIELTQGNTSRKLYVSSAKETHHTVVLNETDAHLISTNATSVRTFWFVDCIHYDQTLDYKFTFNYTDPMKTHIVEALVVVSYDPITTTTEVPSTTPSTNITTPIPATNTTTVSTTTSTAVTTTAATATNATTSVPITTPVPTSSTTATAGMVNTSAKSLDVTDSTIPPSNMSVSFPFVCLNSSVIPADPKKTYGYFNKKVQVKAPIAKVTIDGTYWLQHGDLMKLQVSWEGSPDYWYCLQEYFGIYNVTGNEDCGSNRNPIENNTLNIKHYFRRSGTYTYVIIVENDVSKNITQVAINVYEVTKQAQLSVIIVPVACSLVAVILIVFGVAYYIQSRNTYTVEVADFNFGQRDNMEYKTFRERLREAFLLGNGFTEIGKPSDSWGPGGSSTGDYARMN